MKSWETILLLINNKINCIKGVLSAINVSKAFVILLIENIIDSSDNICSVLIKEISLDNNGIIGFVIILKK